MTDLATAELTLTGRITTASNATFLGNIDDVLVVYKPIAGESPLWDFPHGTLAHRELAGYLISQTFSWDIVPHTWLRTVLWRWRGDALTAEEHAGIHRVSEGLHSGLGQDLADLLSAEEIASLAVRCARLGLTGRFPAPSGEMSAVPWPLF